MTCFIAKPLSIGLSIIPTYVDHRATTFAPVFITAPAEGTGAVAPAPPETGLPIIPSHLMGHHCEGIINRDTANGRFITVTAVRTHLEGALGQHYHLRTLIARIEGIAEDTARHQGLTRGTENAQQNSQCYQPTYHA